MDAIEAWLYGLTTWLYGLTTLEVIGLTGVFVLILILRLVQRIHNFLVEIMDDLRRIETDVGEMTPNLVDDYHPDQEPDWVDGPKR